MSCVIKPDDLKRIENVKLLPIYHNERLKKQDNAKFDFNFLFSFKQEEEIVKKTVDRILKLAFINCEEEELILLLNNIKECRFYFAVAEYATERTELLRANCGFEDYYKLYCRLSVYHSKRMLSYRNFFPEEI